MTWEYAENSPYVENVSNYPLHPTTPLQSTSSFWPTPPTQAGLTPSLTPHQGGSQLQSLKRATGIPQTPPSHISPTQRYFPSVQPSALPPTMTDPRRMSSSGQRPIMGPPETPSRSMIQASPNLFPTPLFSPDMFSHSHLEPQSAPVYPQQRLFWDPASTPLTSTPQHFQTPSAFPDHFATSFDSNATVMQPDFHISQDEQSYDLPNPSNTMDMSTSFISPSPFPAPFQTSPNLRAPVPENPTQFLSSPARRFGGPELNAFTQTRRAQPELPAYHHQIEEARREKEANVRKRSRAPRRVPEEDLVMKSVRRALSPVKQPRPGLRRSNTHNGVRLSTANGRRPSQVTFADAISVSSNTSSRSGTGSRLSPSRRGQSKRQSSPSVIKPRSSMSLAIDDHGVARTIMTRHPADEDGEMDMDNSRSEASTEEEEEDNYDDDDDDGDDNQRMLYSFTGEHYDLSEQPLHSDAREHLKRNTYLSMGSDRVARVRNIDPRLTDNDPMATIKPSRQWERMTVLASNNNSSTTPTADTGNARQALRAIIQNRSRSASSHGGQSSNSSVQFHSSPPVQQGQLSNYNNASPTTITDPDLATPSTDADSVSSKSGTRCVCHSTSPDGNIMIQCENCTKWLHAKCVGLSRGNLPEIYICVYCEQNQGTSHQSSRLSGARSRSSVHARSPLAHKGSGRGSLRR